MKQIPLILMIGLAIFIPVVAYVTLQATSSMFKYVKYYRKLKIIKMIRVFTIFHFTITKYFNTYFRFSDLYDERVETYRKEKKKTEKLLTDLLPRSVIRKMKRVCSSMIYIFCIISVLDKNLFNCMIQNRTMIIFYREMFLPRNHLIAYPFSIVTLSNSQIFHRRALLNKLLKC